MSRQPRTSIPTEDLRALFDIAVNSMDFGSGFLDTDEVKLLRAIAVLVGVDPRKATPHEFTSQFPHPFQTHYDEALAICGENYGRCLKAADHPIHEVPNA